MEQRSQGGRDADESTLERAVRRLQRWVDTVATLAQTLIRLLTPIVIVAALAYYAAIGETFSIFGIRVRAISLTFVLIAIASLIAIGIVFSMYLESGGSSLRNLFASRRLSASSDEVSQTVVRLERRIDDIESRDVISLSEREALINELKVRFTKDAARSIVDDLRTSFKAASMETFIAESESATLNRLREERLRLARRANMNLFLGIVITVIGLVLLLTYAQDQLATIRTVRAEHATAAAEVRQNAISKDISEASLPDLRVYLLTFIPRLSLVVLIELFAYFFLGLYKISLAEVKYVQNEMTTVESRVLALGVAIQLGERGTIGEVVRTVASTDRNTSRTPAMNGDASADKVLEVVKELIGTLK
jgi:flagellar motor component MotA